MTTLVVVSTATEGADAALLEYVERVVPMFVAAGAVPVKRLHVTDMIAGESDPSFVFVADFEDADTIRAVFESEAYEALVPLRDAGFDTIDIMITEDN